MSETHKHTRNRAQLCSQVHWGEREPGVIQGTTSRRCGAGVPSFPLPHTPLCASSGVRVRACVGPGAAPSPAALRPGPEALASAARSPCTRRTEGVLAWPPAAPAGGLWPAGNCQTPAERAEVTRRADGIGTDFTRGRRAGDRRQGAVGTVEKGGSPRPPLGGAQCPAGMRSPWRDCANTDCGAAPLPF